MNQTKTRIIATSLAILVVAGFLIIRFSDVGRNSDNSTISPQLDKVSLRLQWIPQTQFAGYLVAKELGMYEAEGIDVDIRPAGPDLKPHLTVAAGTDDFGVGVSNQIILARAQGVPLKIVSQIFQDSANRYILKNKDQISELKELTGSKVGLWLAGDEAEFVAMLANQGMELKDVKVIPQEYSIVPFLKGEYKLSQVTIYNELIQVLGEVGPEAIQVLSPADFDAAIPGDMLFTSENMIETNPDLVRSFVNASIKGWKYAIENPEEATLKIIEAYPELEYETQLKMLLAVSNLVKPNLDTKIGAMNLADYREAQAVLLKSGQLNRKINLNLLTWPSPK